jgi:hypothetical protein
MGIIVLLHRLFGGMILPLLPLGAAICFMVTWKPDRWPVSRHACSHPGRCPVHARAKQLDLPDPVWCRRALLGVPFSVASDRGTARGHVGAAPVRQLGLAARLGRCAPLATLILA